MSFLLIFSFSKYFFDNDSDLFIAHNSKIDLNIILNKLITKYENKKYIFDTLNIHNITNTKKVISSKLENIKFKMVETKN